MLRLLARSAKRTATLRAACASSGGPVQPEVGFVVHSPGIPSARDCRADYGSPLDDRQAWRSYGTSWATGEGQRRRPSPGATPAGDWTSSNMEIEQRAWGIGEADPTLVFRRGQGLRLGRCLEAPHRASLKSRKSVNPGLKTFLRATRDADPSCALTISGASLPRGSRKRPGRFPHLRRAGAARLLRALYREDNFWKPALCSAPGGGDRRPAAKGARRDRLESGIVT